MAGAGMKPIGLLNPLTPMVMFLRAGAALGYGVRLVKFVTTKLFMPDVIKPFVGYTPTPSDIFITTFAKSGTNWAMQICQQIACRGAAEFNHIHELVAWPEAKLPGVVALDDPRPQREAPTGLRVIKTHELAGRVPFGPEGRYVTIVRDPKEVVVSSYHFLLGMFGVRHRVSPSEWADAWCSDGYLGELWAEHTAGYWALRDEPNVLVRTFDEVKADLPGFVDDAAALVGVTLAAKEREAVLERSSFRHMKANKIKFAPPQFPLARADQFPDMIRRGKSGDSGELLTTEQQGRIDEACQGWLEAAGSDFPYRERFIR